MTIVTLHARSVTTSTGNPLDPPTVTGSGDIWSDSVTTTGAEVWSSFDSSFRASAFTDWAVATLDQLVLPSGATVNAITSYMTADTTSSPVVTSPDPRVDITLHEAAHSSSPFDTSFQEWVHNNVGVGLATYSQAIDPSFRTFLSEVGNTVMIRRLIPSGATSPYHHSVFIAEYRIDVDYSGGVTPPPTVTYAPPLRLTNRDDVFASAPRLTGSTSRQGSNRLTGYL